MSHREITQSQNEAEIAERLRELPKDGVAQILNEQAVSDEQGGWFVPLERAATVRTQITAIHNYSEKKFKTNKADGGINIWREA